MEILSALQLQAYNPGAAIGIKWLTAGNNGKSLASINPSSAQVIAHVNTAILTDYENMMEEASLAALAWRDVPAPKRGEIIRQIGEKLRAHKKELGRLVSLEMGKSLQEGEGEVQEMIDMSDYAVGLSRMLSGNTFPSERKEHRLFEQWHPYGIVGVITAFNFPVAVWAWNAFLAAICGNVTIWKPSSLTPLCAVAVHTLCNQVMRANNTPAIFGYFVPEDHLLAERFIADKRVALVSFTGSTATGREVAQTVAKRLGKTLLELGGNNAVIIDETANLDLALPAILFGAIGTAGQRCTSTRRVFVHQSIYPEFLQRLRHAYQQITLGDPLDPRTMMGPLASLASVNAYHLALASLEKQGAELFHGGSSLPEQGYFVRPVIVTGIRNDWELVQQETFAPILYLMPFTDLAEAIRQQNAVPQGLSSALFTNDLRHSELFLSAAGSDCGIANINIGTSGAEIGGAFGGEKDTGGGREAGSDAWKAYMRRQTNTLNWGSSMPLAQGIQFELS
jgi:aldehyde dehydrogenase (NAD+)